VGCWPRPRPRPRWRPSTLEVSVNPFKLAGDVAGVVAVVVASSLALSWGHVQRMVEDRLCSAGIPVTVYDA
jgi:hypothetical protein